jgi:fructokinase
MKQLIVGLGEALWDCLPEGRKLGGAPANFAYHTGQFGHDSLAISAVGNDALGKETLDEFDKKGVNYLMPEVDYQTGTVQVELDSEGIPTYDIKEGVAWDNIPFTPEIEEAAKNCRAVCFGSLAQRSSVSRQTIQKFLEATPKDCLKIFDINLRQNFYTKEIITNSLQHANILKINDEELVLIGRLFGYPGLDIGEQVLVAFRKVQP